MIPSTRGVLPRRPDAVTSTARRSVATEAFQGPSTTAETPREPVLLHAAGLLAHGIACEVARGVREKRKLFLGPSRASPRRTGVGSPRARKRALPTAWRTVKPPSLSGRRSRRPSLAVFGGALRRRFTHIQMLFTWNLAPPRSSCISPEYLLLPPRSAPDRAAARARARPSTLGPRPLTRSPLRRSGEHRTRRFSAIHFRGPLIRQVSCYTLLSGFRLPWPPSCCHHQRAPFRYLG